MKINRLLLAELAAIMICGGQDLRIVNAAKNNNRASLSGLLQKHADVNATEGDGSTALHYACYRDNAEAVDLLIRAGANVNAANDLGATPLWIAGLNGNAGIVRRLLDAGADPNAKLLSGETSVMVSARSGHAEVLQALLEKGGNPNARAVRGQTALMWAVAQKHAPAVKVLLAHGADVRARTETWSQMMAAPPHGHPEYNRLIPHGRDTALLFAARAGDLDSAKLLLSAGADVNDTDAWGVSATVMAAHVGCLPLVQYLLEKGANANSAEAGFSALHTAIMRRDEKMVSALLKHGADPNTPLRVWTPTRRSSRDFHFEPILVGATPFWLASRFLQPATMRLLAQHGADPRFVHRAKYVKDDLKPRTESTTAPMAVVGLGGGSAWTPIPTADRNALLLEAAKAAVELGADINAVNSDGKTALDAAKSLGHDAVVKFLIERGARSGRAH